MFNVILRAPSTSMRHYYRVLTKSLLYVALNEGIFAGMSLFITSLNSGSNGNCYYIGNDTEAVLVDAGLSCRETEKRMHRLDLSMDKVKALFISHEHGDHIRGVESIAAKHKLPVYITPHTFQKSRLRVADAQVFPFSAYAPVTIGGLSVTAFPKFHDACDPHSFVIAGNGVKIGVFTDIGATCSHVIDNFSECHAVFLEANYDEAMLQNGRYPYHLKNRIRGGHGHLSNAQALELFIAHRPVFLTHLLLSHLSKDNNDPDLALNMFAAHARNTHVVVASRYQESSVYHITATAQVAHKPSVYRKAPVKSVQISLF